MKWLFMPFSVSISNYSSVVFETLLMIKETDHDWLW